MNPLTQLHTHRYDVEEGTKYDKKEEISLLYTKSNEDSILNTIMIARKEERERKGREYILDKTNSHILTLFT